MRTALIGLVGLGALFVGYVAGGCSSSGETPFDAGTLPDGFSAAEGGSPDTSVSPTGTDGGDATVGPGIDAGSTGEDAGDSSTTVHDGGLDAAVDAHDGASPAADASDASLPDASDASAADASDAGDASLREDASDSSLADASDAATEDASDAAVADAADGAAFDASAACAALNGADPIQGVLSGVVLSDGGVVVINYQRGASTSGSGQAPAGDTVTFEAWTTPVGVMSSISVMYWLNADSGSIQSIPLVPGPGTAGEDSWTGTLPAQGSGTTVTWWVQGTDVCHVGTDYYSNSGANYVYTTQ